MKKIYEKFKKIMSKEEVKYYFLIFIISFFICTPLLIGHSQGHDAIYHISRTVGTEIAVKEGQIPPLISSNFVNGFGYSWNIFYPPLPNYIMMIIKLILHSYTKALNILIFLSVFVSGIAMFTLIKKITKSNKISILSSIIYMLAPYRLVDIYIRGALGEVLAFTFIPLVFLGLYNILEDKGKRHYWLVIGAVGLLLSHNISTLLMIIVAAIYLLVNIKKVFKKDVIKYLVLDAIFIILIVVFFYVPMIQNKLATDYAVFNELKGSAEGIHDHSVYLYQLLFGKMQYQWSYPLNDANSQNIDMCFALGLTIIIPLIFTPFVYKKINKEKRKLYLTTLFAGLFFLLMTTTVVPWDKLPSVLTFIQYSYRFLLIATFLLAPIAAINLVKLKENIDLENIIVYTLIAFIYITPLLQEAQIIKGLDWKEFYSTEKLEEGQNFSRYCATYEYLPSKAFNNKDYIATRSDEPIIQTGNCNIQNSEKNKLTITFNVNNVEKNTKIELPFIYYVGYNAYLNGEKLEVTESDNGFVQISLNEGQEGIVEVKYEGSVLYYISFAISLISLIIFVIYICVYEIGYKNKKLLKTKN